MHIQGTWYDIKPEWLASGQIKLQETDQLLLTSLFKLK